MIGRLITSLYNHLNERSYLKPTLLIFGLIILIVPICNHYFFRTFHNDYTTYNFAFYDYAHFRVSVNPAMLAENKTFLQDHLSFTFFFFIPLYWLLSWLFGTYTLLIIQSAFILYGGWASYKLIKYHTSSQIFANMGLLLYFVLFGRYSSFITDCNLMIILSSIVPVFLYHFIKGDYKLAIFWFIFLILGRESIPLWMIFISIMLMFMFRNDKVKMRYAVGFALGSLIYFMVAFKFLIPAIEDPGRPFSLFNYAVLGSTPFEALKYMITHPIDCIGLLFKNHSGDPMFDGVKLEFYTTYLVSGGILLLLRPKYLLALIPIIFQKMYNDSYIRWGIESYYSIEIVTLIPILVFFVLSEIKYRKVSVVLGGLACIGALSMTLYKVENENRSLIGWYTNTKYKFYSSEMYRSKYDHKKIYRELERIPDDAKVSASLHLTSHLAFRENIYKFPKIADAEYIALIKNDDTYPLRVETVTTCYEELLLDEEWRVLFEDEEFIMFKREHGSELTSCVE